MCIYLCLLYFQQVWLRYSDTLQACISVSDRWRFVIHGGIDGYSRAIVYLGVGDNNRADTVLTLFKRAVADWGLPSRVRYVCLKWCYMYILFLLNIWCVVFSAIVSFQGAFCWICPMFCCFSSLCQRKSISSLYCWLCGTSQILTCDVWLRTLVHSSVLMHALSCACCCCCNGILKWNHCSKYLWLFCLLCVMCISCFIQAHWHYKRCAKFTFFSSDVFGLVTEKVISSLVHFTYWYRATALEQHQ